MTGSRFSGDLSGLYPDLEEQEEAIPPLVPIPMLDSKGQTVAHPLEPELPPLPQPPVPKRKRGFLTTLVIVTVIALAGLGAAIYLGALEI